MNTHVAPHRRLWMGPQFHFKHYSEATVSVCLPNSNVCTADSPQTSMNIVEADLKSLPYVKSPFFLTENNSTVIVEYNGRNRHQFMCQTHKKKSLLLSLKLVLVAFK